MTDEQDTHSQPLEKIPDGFDLRDVKPKDQQTVIINPPITVDDGERYRVKSGSATCDNPQDTNRILNGRTDDEARREMKRIMNSCSAGDHVDTDIFNDGNTDMGPRGVGKIRIRHRF